MKKNSITKELINWYTYHKRDLPWRDIDDPYKIWLSEIILQQTRVDQGLPYYTIFVDKYPTIFQLAESKLDDVLRSWQGLGYYSRARNLHKCANTIVKKYNGKFPSTRDELIKLPGIGPYTSAAIASFAFGKKEAVVDGNVIRVITRLYGIEENITNRQTAEQIKVIVDDLIPDSDPALFNQAIMEFGALHCIPKKPFCSTCGFLGICNAQKKGNQERIPLKLKKTKKRIRFFNYMIICIDDTYLMRKRKGKDIWNELFEFFLVETNSELSFDNLELPDIMTHNPKMWRIIEESKTYKHLLSHQTIMCRFYEFNVSKEFKFNPVDWEEYQLYSKEEIDDLPKSTLINRYLEEKK